MASRIAVLVADYFEESEVLYPIHRLAEDGHTVVLASPGATPVKGKNGFGPLPVDADVKDINAAELDGLLVPGGFAPDLLRRHDSVLDLVRAVDTAAKPLGFICHGGWVGISAGVLSGRRATSVPAIRVDMENAGVNWVDSGVVVDGHLVTAQVPNDLGAWLRAFLAALSK